MPNEHVLSLLDEHVFSVGNLIDFCLHLFVEYNDDLVALVDSAGRFVFLSPSFGSLGYSRAELFQLRFPNLLHPADLADWQTGHRPGARLRQARIRQADGTWRWLQGWSAELRSGTERYRLEVARDITDWKQAEQIANRRAQSQQGLLHFLQQIFEPAREAEQRMAVLARALEHLRIATAADRMLIMRNVNDQQLGASVEFVVEAVAPDLYQTTPRKNGKLGQRLPWSLAPASHREILATGQASGGAVEQLYAQSPQLLELLRAEGVKATLALPIQLFGRWWGLLVCDDYQRARQWDMEETMLLRTAAEITAQVLARWENEDALRSSETEYRALALENGRLYQLARRRADQIETLLEATALVTTRLTTHDAISSILDECARVVPYARASIQLRNGNYSEVIDCRGFAMPEQIIGQRFLIAGSTLENALYAHGQPQLLSIATATGHFHAADAEAIRAWLALPLRAQSQVIGILTLDSTVADHFTDEHVRLGMAFAGQVAITLEHARRYRREVQARERLTMLQEAVREISARSTSPELLYAAVHTAVSRLMPAEAFVISRLDPFHELVQDVYLADRRGIWSGNAYPLANSLARLLLDQSGPFWFEDLSLLTAEPGLATLSQLPGVRSGLATLIRGRTQVLGLICTLSYSPAAYTDDDVTLFELLAAHVATAWENAMLFAEIERLATTDTLTELLNRRQFFVRAAQEAARAQRGGWPISVIMLDIDHFKHVNDSYGHHVGDQVLRAFAALCRNSLRASDVAGRFGGEEFVLLLPETHADDAVRVAERLRRAITELQVAVGSANVGITASLGVATAMQIVERDLSELLSRADQALYEAKHYGRNRVVVWEPAD